jgi:hypothetical protein
MGIEVSGKIQAVFESKQITERFRKREFVLELSDNSRYPQSVLFQLTGDRCEDLDRFEVGQNVRVEFSLRGREWKSPSGEVKYFNSLDVWTIDEAAAGAGSSPFDEEPPMPEEPPAYSDSDVPF